MITLLACVDSGQEPVESAVHPHESSAPDTGETAAPTATVTMTARAVPPGFDLAVTAEVPVEVVWSCAATDDPTDVLGSGTAAATVHEIAGYGLRPGATYACSVEAAGTWPYTIAVPAAPDTLPNLTVVSTGPTAGPGFLVTNHGRPCVFGIQRLVVYDLQGRVRWYYEDLPPELDLGVQVAYHGGGRFVWGGGKSVDGAVRWVDISGVETYRTDLRGYEGVIFHHDGKLLDDGRVLTLSEADEGGWKGFALQLHDPATGSMSWQWFSQQGVDQGVLVPTAGDVWHANWAAFEATPSGERVYVNLCFTDQLLAIDVDTGEIAWTFGSGGDFVLQDPSGAPVSEDELPQCGHGYDLQDGRLLVHDNGWKRGYTRVAEWRLDEEASVAVLERTWTDDPWFDTILGDVDALGDRWWVTESHTSCLTAETDHTAFVEVEPTTGAEILRATFPDPDDSVYRSERADLCDVIPLEAVCGR